MTLILTVSIFSLCLLMGQAFAGTPERAQAAYDAGEWDKAHELVLRGLEKIPEDPHLRFLLMELELIDLRREGNARGYLDFITKWKSGPLVEQAQIELNHLLFEITMVKDTVHSWARYAQNNPDTPLGRVAAFEEERRAWEEAEKSGSESAYKSFYANYPESPYAMAAKDRLADIAWVDVVTSNTGQAYLDFLLSYPKSVLAIEAARRSEDLIWADAMDANSIEAWRQFRQVFKDTERGAQALEREIEISWLGTLNKHQVSNYRQYELDYSQTPEALDAEVREWDLYHFERNLFEHELKTSIKRAHRQEDGSYTLWFDVLNDKNDLVGGLQKSNFKVYDAGYRGEVLELLGMEHSRPIDVVFVVDISGSMVDEIEGVKDGIARFASLMKLRSRDMRLGLVTFIEEVFESNGRKPTHSVPGGRLTADVPTFLRWVERIDTNKLGSKEHHFLALEMARRLPLRKDAQKVFVLLSDEDVAYDSKFRRSQIIRNMLADDIMVYTVTPEYVNFKQVADQTYGKWFELPQRGSFAPTMNTIAQKLSKQYKMTYRRPLEAPAVRGDLDVVIRIRTDHSWLVDASGHDGVLVFDAKDSSKAYFLLSNGGLQCSDNGGVKWKDCGTGLPLGSQLKALVTDGRLKAVTSDGTVMVSDDFGQSFESFEVGEGATSMAIEAWGGTLFVSDDGSLHSVIENIKLKVHRSDNGGMIGSISAHPVEPLAIYVTDNGEAFRTVDGGKSWDSVNWQHSPPVGFAYHPSRSGLVFAWNESGLSRSLDNGANWHALDSSVAEITQLLFDPTVRRMILAITANGVLGSDDLGRTWFDQNSGLKEIPKGGTVSPKGKIVLNLSSGQSGLTPVANREFIFSQLYYASGATRPGRALLPHLDELALQLKRDSSLILRIEGHADSDGASAMNQTLSEKRADWVAKYLSDRGVPKSRLVAEGYGESRPLFDNKNPRTKSKNRRVELVLIRPSAPPPLTEDMR